MGEEEIRRLEAASSQRLAEANTRLDTAWATMRDLLAAQTSDQVREQLDHLSAAYWAQQNAFLNHMQVLLLSLANTNRRQDQQIQILDSIVLGASPPEGRDG